MDDGRKRRVPSKTAAGATRRTCLAVAVVARRATCGIHKVQYGNTEARRGYRDCVGGRRSARHAFCRAWIAQLLLARRQPHCLLGSRAAPKNRYESGGIFLRPINFKRIGRVRTEHELVWSFTV